MIQTFTVLKTWNLVRLSKNRNHTLGIGMYFWENNPLRAMKWAQTLQKPTQHGKPTIEKLQLSGGQK